MHKFPYRETSEPMQPQKEQEEQSERDALKTRQLPEMILSDGSATSNTAPPPPAPNFQSRQEAALYRFEVQGNAIITGGGGTLALSSARALLEHGLTALSLWDRQFSAPADETISQLQSDFPDASIHKVGVNITSESAVAKAMATTLDAFKAAGRLGRLDAMLCFAGVVGCVPTLECDLSEFQRVWDVNGQGTFLCAQAAGRQMSSSSQEAPLSSSTSTTSTSQHATPRGGSIVLISSISAHTINYPQPQLPYNISKAAVSHMARCMAAEWAVHGIRVNAVSPGYQNTILNEGEGLERARGIWNSRCPMGRMGEPQELQGVVVLLCSRAGNYITGGDFVVDGGMTLF